MVASIETEMEQATASELSVSAGTSRLVTLTATCLCGLQLRGLAVALQDLAGENPLLFRCLMGNGHTDSFAVRLAACFACYLLACALLVTRGQIPSAYRSRVGLCCLLGLDGRADSRPPLISYEQYYLIFDVTFVLTAFLATVSIYWRRRQSSAFLEQLRRHYLTRKEGESLRLRNRQSSEYERDQKER